MTDAILGGIRVVEVGTVVFVPSVGAVLSDYGAEVVKLEAPGGDIYRNFHHLPGMPDSEIDYCWQHLGRNKKSIVVNLKKAEGVRIAHRLVASADVLTTNYHNSVLEDLNLTYDELKALNPGLIYAHGTGFGNAGDDAEAPGYDMVTYWSRSGLEAPFTPIDGFLGTIAPASGDHPSGMALFGGVLLALLRRERTGEGSYVTTSLLANGAWANSCLLQAAINDAAFHERRPREDPINFTSQYYRARDGRVFKLCIVDIEKDWLPFVRALDRPELAADERFATLEVRLENMKAFMAELDATFATRDLEEWAERLTAHEVPWSAISTPQEAAGDPQLRVNDLFTPLEHPQHGTVSLVSTPIEIREHPKREPVAAPALGAQTDELLEELGYDEALRNELRSEGVVA